MEQGQQNSLSSTGIAETRISTENYVCKGELAYPAQHYRALVLADRDNDDFLVELEMSYLFGDDDNEDAEIDVGQSDE